MNVVGTASGQLIEVQGTGEKRTFSRDELEALLDLAHSGIQQLAAAQTEALASILAEVESVRAKGPRKKAAPKSEKDLWGRP